VQFLQYLDQQAQQVQLLQYLDQQARRAPPVRAHPQHHQPYEAHCTDFQPSAGQQTLALTLEKTAKVVSQLLSAHALEIAIKVVALLQSAIPQDTATKELTQLQLENALHLAAKLQILLQLAQLEGL
jgi:hypothetical protein